MNLFDQPFMAHAVLAGTGIAAAAGAVGYFLVLRAQVFTADALSHVAFTGALAALALGVDMRVGLFAATVSVGVGIGAAGRGGHADDVVIGNVFTWILGLGVFFLTLYTTHRSGGSGAGNATTSVLFGSILGLSAHQARTACLIGAGVTAAVVAIARPLLFATLDPAVAAARGVPVRALGLVFLALVGAAAAEATQAVGALLLLALIAAPAGTAAAITDNPFTGLVLSVALAVAETWLGLGLAHHFTRVPPAFAITTLATVGYALAGTHRWYRDRQRNIRRGARRGTEAVRDPARQFTLS
jgi:zinc/manganese transport system permease protein